MLVCACGWRGANLLGNWKHDTAHCPECKTIFQGIKADDARAMSAEEERKIVTNHKTLVEMCDILVTR